MAKIRDKKGSIAKNILIVDDEPDLLEVVTIRLKKAGYKTFGGESGQEALDLARQIIPDLLIIDVYLPKINGDEVTKILKKDDKLKHMPIILISATIKTLPERTKECGAEAYFIKPFEPEELVTKAKELIG